MHFSTIVASAALFAGALASPILSERANPTWTMQSFTRVCPKVSSCNYSYNIVTNDGKPATKCAYTITGANAATTNYQGVKCGIYTIGSGWSGQFGPGNGFQTLSVVGNGYIIYPGYTDKELAAGKAVTPDKSYTPTKLM